MPGVHQILTKGTAIHLPSCLGVTQGRQAKVRRLNLFVSVFLRVCRYPARSESSILSSQLCEGSGATLCARSLSLNRRGRVWVEPVQRDVANAQAQQVRIRMALGAQKRNVLLLVMGQGLKLAGMGVVIGRLAALALTRVIGSLLYETTPNDPLTSAPSKSRFPPEHEFRGRKSLQKNRAAGQGVTQQPGEFRGLDTIVGLRGIFGTSYIKPAPKSVGLTSTISKLGFQHG